PVDVREAVDAVARRSRQRADVGSERPDALGRVERDVHMARAEVVSLDGELRPLDADCREDRRRILDALPRRDRLLHPAEDDPRSLALELDGYDPGARLEPDHDLLERAAEHERAPKGRMAGERQLQRGGEDPEADVGVLDRR